jgi:hypothetical protein
MDDTILRVLDRTGTATDTAMPMLTDNEAAAILIGLSDVGVRDACWLRMEQGGSGRGLALWGHLVRRAVPPYDAAPLFLLGWAAWRRGDGVLARLAAEQALDADADYRAARLLLDAVDACLDPRSVPKLTARRRRLQRPPGGRRR